MAANHLDSSPSSDRSDRFNMHDREKHTPSSSADSEEGNTSLMNGGSLTKREEKKVSAPLSCILIEAILIGLLDEEFI